ncbi:hypothetical protein ABZ876_29445 [Streptomyces sp. NPDC046931]|uniref:imine reductase family protein n=1 Tax=Streptomyces sp. NPDC046931 TaxID=3154806 RepID=UPI0033F11336
MAAIRSSTAVASAFLTAGHPLTVGNRTPGRAGGTPGRGATVASAAAAPARLVEAPEAHGPDAGALAAAKRAAGRAVAGGHGRDGRPRLVTCVAATGATAGVPGPPSGG